MGFFNLKQYNKVVRLAYGKSFYKFQAEVINNEIGKEVLVVGAGNRGIISLLKEDRNYCLIEKSKVFSTQLKNQTQHKKEFQIINEDFFSWKPHQKFDLVIFPFFLDLFTRKEQQNIFLKTFKLLNDDGKVLIIDFEPPKSFLERIHIKLLYLLFRSLDGITGEEIICPKSLNTEVLDSIEGLKSPFFRIKAYRVQPPKP